MGCCRSGETSSLAESSLNLTHHFPFLSCGGLKWTIKTFLLLKLLASLLPEGSMTLCSAWFSLSVCVPLIEPTDRTLLQLLDSGGGAVCMALLDDYPQVPHTQTQTHIVTNPVSINHTKQLLKPFPNKTSAARTEMSVEFVSLCLPPDVLQQLHLYPLRPFQLLHAELNVLQ